MAELKEINYFFLGATESGGSKIGQPLAKNHGSFF